MDTIVVSFQQMERLTHLFCLLGFKKSLLDQKAVLHPRVGYQEMFQASPKRCCGMAGSTHDSRFHNNKCFMRVTEDPKGFCRHDHGLGDT